MSNSVAAEFTDLAGLKSGWSINRTLAYELLKEGRISSVVLRRDGFVRGKPLISVESVRQYIRSLDGNIDPLLSEHLRRARAVGVKNQRLEKERERESKLRREGEIIASEEVYVELAKKDDDLHDWIQARKSMLVAPDEAIQQRVAEILTKHPRLVDTLKGRSQADPFVIATAIERDAVVVTGELMGSVGKPRIPFVCQAEAVRCITFLDMIRELKFTF